MKKLLQKLLNFILPRRCLYCGKIIDTDEELCEKCFAGLNFILPPYCRKCGHPLEEAKNSTKLLCPTCAQKRRTPFRLSRSAMYYDDASKKLILAFKFMDKTENSHLLATMLKYAGKDIFDAGVDVIVPVPLHYSRLLKRKYNQSALLANDLSKMTGIAADLTSLIRHKKTPPQVQFSGWERVRNVKRAFQVPHPEHIKGKRVLLIDDVLTTGSTLKECALALKKAGAKSVDTLTVARVC